MSMICEVYAVSDDKARDLLADPSSVHELLAELQESDAALSLEKSWHGLHFVLTSTAWEGPSPLNFIAGGGLPIGDEDLGYGPARLLTANEVKALDLALDAFSDSEFNRRFDIQGLADADIYPPIWDEPVEDLRQEYSEYFQQLKSHVKSAAESGHALLVAIT